MLVKGATLQERRKKRQSNKNGGLEFKAPYGKDLTISEKIASM
ncbi:hypothetical protein PanWU01x14_080950 [Parasponia andersonii]|uniref:Uncharacterized protein n=1 Tax=Parasponia andersonii TaxID=3476 RepID=A0A2P5DAV4_PARAD|nr:hypothetical protein PanWU01x14_080950 [Parasponia andersonii]